MFFCAISASPPTHPVVSSKSGHVYEKSLIQQYITQNGTDPITGNPLTLSDLIDVKANPQTLPPRPPTQSSVPSLLSTLQTEFDAVILESLEIKKAYQASRQELANALYREDAGVRALARIIKERDEARAALSSIQATIGVQAPAASDDVEMQESSAKENALPSEVESILAETNAALSSVRRKRKPAAGYSKPADIKSFTQTTTVPSLHSTKPVGITALDLDATGQLALTGGADKTVQLYDFDSEKTLATLKGHTKAITQVEFVGGDQDLLLSSSQDKTVKLWKSSAAGEKKAWSLGHNYTGHKGEIVGFAVHPSKRFVAMASSDTTWSLRDLETHQTVKTYSPIPSFEGSFTYSGFSMHPDGILFGAGTDDGKIRIWDARDDSTLAATLDSHPTPVTSLSFSENGYYLASASRQSHEVNLFDLRKLSLLHTIPSSSNTGTIHQVRFDPSAQFLSVVGTDARVYQNKTWDELVRFDDNAAELTGARFGLDGKRLVLAGLDRTLRVLEGK